MSTLLPNFLRGPVATAFYGGWSTARILHTPCPAALADISGAYGWSYSTQGLQRFDMAEQWTARTVTEEVRSLSDHFHLRQEILGNELPLRGRLVLVKVHPHGEVILPTKAKRSGTVRLSFAPTDLWGDACWWWLSDVLAGVALGGRFPDDIAEACEIVAGDVRTDVHPVCLPNGRLVDPQTEDLLLAFREERDRIATDPGIAEWQRDGWAGQLRLLSSIVAFGNRARIDRDTLQTALPDEVVIFNGERLCLKTPHPEHPGPHFNLTIAGAVTSRVRLAMAQVIGGLTEQGGDWLHIATDAVLAAATHSAEPEFVPCNGGPHRSGRSSGILALPIKTVEEVLARSGAPWKLKSGFDRPMIGYVSGTYKTALVDPASGEGTATEAMLGGIYADPTGTDERTPDGRFCWAEQAHLAVARAGIAWNGSGPFPELVLSETADRLAVRPGVASTPEIVARLQRVFPDRTVRPFAPYWMAVVDPLRSCAIPVTLDVHLSPSERLQAEWRDQRDGSPVILSLADPHPEGAVRGRTYGEVLDAWKQPQDPTTTPAEVVDHVLQPGIHTPVPVRSRAALFEPTGKEGDDLLSLMVDPMAEKGDQLNVYRRADTWATVQEAAQSIGAADLVRLTGLSERTARRVVQGKRVSAETAAVVGAVLDGAGPIPPRSCERTGCSAVVTGRQRFCSDRCRKATARAKDQLSLHKIGAVRCRRCNSIRYGDLSGPCPSCEGKGRSSVSGLECPGCGVIRVGDLDAPCPFCGSEAAA